MSAEGALDPVSGDGTDSLNPYRAPAAQVDSGRTGRSLPIEAAGRWRRFFNLLIDTAACWALTFLGMFVYVVAVVAADPYADISWLDQTNLLRDYAIGIAGMLLYYVPLEALFGWTLGKLLTGTRVVNESGDRPSWGQVIGRTFARMIPFEPFSILFCGDRQVRGWHDSLPRTWVVRKR